MPDPGHANDILPLVDAVFTLLDLFAAGKVVLRPETKAKIRKVREEVEKEIKEEEARDKKEEVCFLPLHHCPPSPSLSRLPKTKRPPSARQSRIGLQSSAQPSRKRSCPCLSCLPTVVSHSDYQLLERSHKRAIRKSQGKVVRKA